MKLFACFFSTYQTLAYTTTGDGWMSIWRTQQQKKNEKKMKTTIYRSAKEKNEEIWESFKFNAFIKHERGVRYQS